MIIRKFKLDYDWKEFVYELDERYPLENYEFYNEFPTPNGSYYYNILEGNMPPHLRQAIERSIGKKIKDFYFLWDLRTITTTIERHKDTYGAALNTGISDFNKHIFEKDAKIKGTPPLTVVVALENDFRLDVFNDDIDEWESIQYGPGDIIFFNNNKFFHGGDVLNDPKNISRRSLNCYVDHSEIDNDSTFWKERPYHIPWPNIKTKIENNKQKVPLKENYAFEDMAYLDTDEAYPIFEAQADIIINKKSKGIVDIGCRHGPILKILHERGYTDFKYMGFDTSVEPIKIAQKKWKKYSNIEFRCESWNNLETFLVDFNVDQVIWSGVLLYKPDNHFEFFNNIMTKIYKSKNAIIQEPIKFQRHWQTGLILNSISDEFDEYKKMYKEFKEINLDLEVFAGRRVIVDVTIS